jgi:hypothetical protein
MAFRIEDILKDPVYRNRQEWQHVFSRRVCYCAAGKKVAAMDFVQGWRRQNLKILAVRNLAI